MAGSGEVVALQKFLPSEGSQTCVSIMSSSHSAKTSHYLVCMSKSNSLVRQAWKIKVR